VIGTQAHHAVIMQTRFLGKTGVKVSAIAFGTMSFGGDADESTSAALFGACRDAGVTFFDCANVYAKGESERILGKLIAPCRDELVISTKAYFPMGEGGNDRGSSRYHIVRAVEASLMRLATDRIDLFFLHRFDEHTALEESLRAVSDLVRAGKIVYPAVSNFAAWQVQKALGIAALSDLAPIVAIQPMYNLVKRQAEVEILPQAKSEGLAVFPYSPLAAGLLSGKYGTTDRPEGARLVSNAMYSARYADASIYDVAERFRALATELGVHPVTLAVAWVRAHPAVTAPLIGARNVEQLLPALAAGSFEMTSEVYARIAALSPEPPPATDRSDERSAAFLGRR
jgi:aryl-alcohol dehydrogenase-like predicted oxidoreductase